MTSKMSSGHVEKMLKNKSNKIYCHFKRNEKVKEARSFKTIGKTVC